MAPRRYHASVRSTIQLLETMPKLARLDLRLGKVDRPKVLDRLAKLGVEILRNE